MKCCLCGSFDVFDIPVDMRTPLWDLAISVALTMKVMQFLAAHGNSISCVLIAEVTGTYGVSSHLGHGSLSQVSRYVNLSPHNIHTYIHNCAPVRVSTTQEYSTT